MKRRLIVGERIMYANGDVPLNCTYTITLNGTLSLASIKAALAKCQQKHPLLRAGIEEDDKGMPWFIIRENAPEIPVHEIERQTHDDWVKETARQFELAFAWQQAPLARLVWLRSETISELMIVMPHCICDGTTILNLMQELLEYMDNPEAAVTPYTTFNSVLDLIPESSLPDKKALKKAKTFSLIATAFLSLKTIGRKTVTNKNYMVRWQMDKEASGRIIDWCKEHGITAHAVIGTAVLHAFRNIRGAEARNKLICPVDIRRYVKAIKTDTMFAFAPIAELSLSKDKTLDFAGQAKDLKAQLQQKVLALNGCEMLAASEYFHAAVKKMTKLLRTTKGGHDVTFSNVGVIPLQQQYAQFQVIRAYSPNAAFPWRNPNTLVVSSFDGCMDFTLLSAEGFLPREQALAIKDAVLTELSQYRLAEVIS